MLRQFGLGFLLCSLVVVGLPVTAETERPAFRHISEESGLSNGTVFSVVQDLQGYVWFGTADGLNRHDGVSTKVFRHDPADPQSLSANWVRQILVDGDGVIWVGTWTGGVNRFDPATESFVHYRSDPDDPHSLSDDSIRAMYQSRDGAIWIGTQSGGLNRLDVESGRFERFTHDPNDPRSLSHDHIEVIYQTRDDVIWVGTKAGGLNELDGRSRTFTHYQHDPNRPEGLAHNDVRGLYEDPSGGLWIATWGGGLQRFDRDIREFTHYRHEPGNPKSLSSDNVRQVLEDSRGNFWVATAAGLNRLNLPLDQFESFRHDPSDPYSLSHDHVRWIFEDRQGGLWLATMGGGVDRHDPATEGFASRILRANTGATPGTSTVMALSEDPSGNLWVGTNGSGLLRFEPGQVSPVRYRADSNDPTSLSHDNIWALLTDRTGALWVGTEGGGLNVWTPQDGRFVHYRHDPSDPNSLSHDHVTAIIESGDGNLWVGTDGGGLNRLDPASGRFTRYRHDPVRDDSLSHDHVLSIHEDRYGLLWIGTWGGGLNLFNPDTGQFTRFRHDPANPDSLSNDSISSVHEDRSGSVWIATIGGGLNRFNRKLQTFERFGPQQGLRVGGLTCLQSDDAGNLWISTLNGLFALDVASMTFRQFQQNDGLIRNQLSQACLRNSRGEILVASWDGLTRFHPSRVPINDHVPPMVITQLELDHDPVPIGAQSALHRTDAATGTLILSPEQQVLSLEFAALDYRDPQRNLYRYRLEGFERDWQEVDRTRRRATYTNLDPGDYVFRVQGSNNHGVWNESGASLRITKLPAWWQKWWSRFAAAMVVAGLLAAAFRMRVVQIRRRSDWLDRVLESTPDALLLSSESGTVLYANGQAEVLFGYAKRELVGSTLDLVVAERSRQSHARARAAFLDRSGGVPASPAEQVYAVRRGGHEFPVDITFGIVKLDDGTALSTAVRDVSQHKEAERNLREALAETTRLRRRLATENRMLREEVVERGRFGEIVGNSDSLQQVLFQVEQVATTDASVLILGETGTGKELVARAVHGSSGRKDRPYVTVNCAAIPNELLESELFGHEKGAFTGAHDRRVGRFELADGGTLFLDEIGELSPALQAKLLRVLESGEFDRLGSTQPRRVDVRILAATNRNIDDAISDGAFRPDLYFRISGFSITLPPLRDRRDDIPDLVWHFIRELNRRLGRSVDRVSQGVMDRLVRADWPGNVRELRNVIERGLILSQGSTLRLPEFHADGAREGTPGKVKPLSLEDAERAHIQRVLDECSWKINGKGGAAERLVLNPSTLRFRMKKLGIRRPGRVPATRRSSRRPALDGP